MKKIKTLTSMFIVGILVASLLAIGMYFLGVQPLASLNKIMTKGTETTATVTDLIESNTTVNNSATYHLEVKYSDANGNIKTGTSIDFLSLRESKEIFDLLKSGEKVEYKIKYLGDKLVVGKSLFSTAAISDFSFCIGFGIVTLICVGFIVMFVLTALQSRKMNIALETGETFPGVFLETGKSIAMGPTRYYSITYEYTNCNEEVILAKSPKNYTHKEAEILRTARNFDVKAIGKTSVIAHDFTATPITAPTAPHIDPFN